MANADNGDEITVEGASQDTPRISTHSAKSAPIPKTPSIGARRTEKPTEPTRLYGITNVIPEVETTIGNNELIFMTKATGQLGIFYDRQSTMNVPTAIELNPENFREAIYATTIEICDRLLSAREYLTLPESQMDAATLAQHLTYGVSVATYLKIKAVNYLDTRFKNRFYKRPMVSDPFEIPQPYALALSQLGQMKVSGLPDELYVTPMIPTDAGGNLCLPTGITWSAATYNRAVDFAKKIGLQFSTVDLGVKMGSSWWIYRSVEEDNLFQLSCPVPEENFTMQTAALRTLFCINAAGGLNNPIFNLDPLGNDTYGTMLRNPPHRVDVSTFYAVEGSFETVWKVA